MSKFLIIGGIAGAIFLIMKSRDSSGSKWTTISEINGIKLDTRKNVYV